MTTTILADLKQEYAPSPPPECLKCGAPLSSLFVGRDAAHWAHSREYWAEFRCNEWALHKRPIQERINGDQRVLDTVKNLEDAIAALQQIKDEIRRKFYYRLDILSLADECLKRVGVASADSAQNG